jgi:DnaJ domain
MDDQDPRAVLGLPPGATRDEAQRAFRRLAKLTHPDAGGESADFRAVARAWADLAAGLPAGRRTTGPSPHVRAYRAPVTHVVWAEPRPPVRRDFARILDAAMSRPAA